MNSDTLGADGLNWGRIVTVISYVGLVAVELNEKIGDEEELEKLTDIVANTMHAEIVGRLERPVGDPEMITT